MTSSDSAAHKANFNVAHQIAQCLLRHGVKEVFGQSLPSALHLEASKLGIRQVAYRTENAGAAMADGFARVSGRLGVVTAQNGPAATLLVPGLAEAYKASVPVLALVQEVSRTDVDKNAFQEFNHDDLFRSCAKWIRRIDQVSRVEDYIDMAITHATSGRPGPVVLMLPSDLLIEAAEIVEARDAQLGHYPLDRAMPSEHQLGDVARLIVEADNPVIVAGGGIHLSQAWESLSDLQEQLSIPVATTVMGKGAIDELHPLSMGVVGYFMGKYGATRHMRQLIDDADLIVLVGNRTNQNGTDSWKLFPKAARYIHIDVDPTEIGRNYESIRLNGDANLTLKGILKKAQTQDLTKRQKSRPNFEKLIADAKRRHQEEAASVMRSTATPLRPERVMASLDESLDEQTTVVSDASYSSIWMANYLRSRRAGMRFLSPRGLAGLGWGLPLALGAKAARPDARVVCIAGDGGFAHSWAELETARRMDLDITLILLNNSVLGYQMHAETFRFGEYTDACHFTDVNHVPIAETCGWNAVRVDRADSLDEAIRQSTGPGRHFIEAVVDPAAFPPITFMEPFHDRT